MRTMQTGCLDTDRLKKLDFEAHNEEVRDAWEALDSGRPYRTLSILGTATRYFLLNDGANPNRMTFREYFEDPDVQFDARLQFDRWLRFNLLQDTELGIPDRWRITCDFQNVYEAAWFGAPIEYPEDNVPASNGAFEECPEKVMENGLPDVYGGFLAMGMEFYEHFQDRARNEEYLGRPIEILPPGYGYGTDGPFTVACNLFGSAWTCMALAAEPSRLHTLLDFITEATILRMKTWRERHGIPVPQNGFICADDSVALISTRMYREHVLPYHKRIFDAFATDKGRGIHLCGDATRHFKTMREELGLSFFDTGFPVDFGAIRRELGPDVTIQGGPHVDLLLMGTPEDVRQETLRILNSGILDGGRFILREGNNLAPHTPLENTEMMYWTGREHGFRPPA